MPGVFICSLSGFKFPISEAVKNWNGLLVHRSFVDKRNPQDFVKAVPESMALPVSNPEPTDTFLGTNEVTAASL